MSWARFFVVFMAGGNPRVWLWDEGTVILPIIPQNVSPGPSTTSIVTVGDKVWLPQMAIPEHRMIL